MRRPHSYVTRFRCPKCKRAGSAKWEESERAAGGGHVSTLKTLTDGFRSHGPHNQIQCSACTAQVVFGHG